MTTLTSMRNSVPILSQIFMLRSMLESLVDKSGGKKAPRKEIDSQHVQTIENFLKVSFLWPYLLDFQGMRDIKSGKQYCTFFTNQGQVCKLMIYNLLEVTVFTSC